MHVYNVHIPNSHPDKAHTFEVAITINTYVQQSLYKMANGIL